MKILVTGAAGFIGYHLCRKLSQHSPSPSHFQILGIDNLNNYYDPALKQARLNQLKPLENFQFTHLDLADRAGMEQLFQQHQFDVVVNLAAQAGVRYSLTNPNAYMDANTVGFCHVLEGCRKQQVKHLVFASSSSVYGANTKYPFSENDNIDHPVSIYAASKKANELMAHSYAHLYGFPCTGLRFFTVYGPWGRPDMALFKFTKNILENKPIDIYNHGDMYRDFTYIDDIINGVLKIIEQPAMPDPNWSSENPNPASSNAPFRIYNIGFGNPVKLTDFIDALEKRIGKASIKNYLPLQAGDVYKTFADTSKLKNEIGYQPKISIEDGINRFMDWYEQYTAALP